MTRTEPSTQTVDSLPLSQSDIIVVARGNYFETFLIFIELRDNATAIVLGCKQWEKRINRKGGKNVIYEGSAYHITVKKSSILVSSREGVDRFFSGEVAAEAIEDLRSGANPDTVAQRLIESLDDEEDEEERTDWLDLSFLIIYLLSF